MSWLKNLFGKDKTPAPRELRRIEELQVGDFLQLSDSFALPSELRNQQLKVSAVTTTEFADGHAPCFELRGAENIPLFLTVDEDDSEQICFSLKITREQVDKLFGLEQFSEIFEPGHSELPVQAAANELGELSGWVGEHYFEEDDAVTGYYHRADYRGSEPPQYQDERHGAMFQYYSLYSQDSKYGIEVEVYEGGDTEISLVLIRPRSDVRELYPSS